MQFVITKQESQKYDKRFVGNSLRVILKRFRKNKKR